jgi:hypothetical protein
MPVFHNFKHVPLEIYFSIKELIVKFLHRQFLSSLSIFPKFTVFQVDIMINGFTGEWDFFVNPLTDSRHDSPISNSDGNTSEETKEEVECPSCLEWEELGDEPWDSDDSAGEMEIVERSGTFSWERGIRNGLVVGPSSQLRPTKGDNSLRGEGRFGRAIVRLDWVRHLLYMQVERKRHKSKWGISRLDWLRRGRAGISG